MPDKRTYKGMVLQVLNHLKAGYELSAADAAELWNEYNARNKISVLRSDGWPILDREEPSPRHGKFKIYYMLMDKSKWPQQ